MRTPTTGRVDKPGPLSSPSRNASLVRFAPPTKSNVTRESISNKSAEVLTRTRFFAVSVFTNGNSELVISVAELVISVALINYLSFELCEAISVKAFEKALTGKH